VQSVNVKHTMWSLTSRKSPGQCYSWHVPHSRPAVGYSPDAQTPRCLGIINQLQARCGPNAVGVLCNLDVPLQPKASVSAELSGSRSSLPPNVAQTKQMSPDIGATHHRCHHYIWQQTPKRGCAC
jgi:hypothetical protein